jgi:putative ABC transport system ATP-binding protein
VAAPPDNDVLRARGLHYSYDGSPALQSVSLGVRAGEIVAITGPRGSGKTTLLSCLSGQLPCMGGGLWFDGKPMHTLGRGARERLRRDHFGWVGSKPQLIPELTAWENAALPLLLGGTGHRTARKTACEWLDRLDIGACARKRPAMLRSSERQRVAIARALAHSPAILFADEPTAPLHRAEHVLALRTLTTAARSHNITVVLATHDPKFETSQGPGPVRALDVPVTDRVLTLIDGLLSGPTVLVHEGEAEAEAGAGAEVAADAKVAADAEVATGPGGEKTGATAGDDDSDGNDSKGAECSLSV